MCTFISQTYEIVDREEKEERQTERDRERERKRNTDDKSKIIKLSTAIHRF